MFVGSFIRHLKYSFREMESSNLGQQLPIELVSHLIAIFFGGKAFEWNNKEVIQVLVPYFARLGYDPYKMALSSGLCVMDYISKITSYVPCHKTINKAAKIGNYEILCHLITIKTRDVHDNHYSFLRKLEKRLCLLAYHGHLETLKRCCQLIQKLPEKIYKEITHNAALCGHIEILDWLLKNVFLCSTEAYCGAMGSENYDQVMEWLLKNMCGWNEHCVIKAALEYGNAQGLEYFINKFMKNDKCTDAYWEPYILEAHEECFEYLVTLMQGPFNVDILIVAMEWGYVGALTLIWDKDVELHNNNRNSGIFGIFSLICKGWICRMPVDPLRWLKDHGYGFYLGSVQWAIKGEDPDIDVVKFLVEEYGFAVDTGNACRNAVKCVNLPILTYLLEKGYPINCTECLQIAFEHARLSPDDGNVNEMLMWLQINQ